MSSRSDDWVCGDCRSLNRAKSKRCYRCGVLRVAGEMTDADAAMTTSAPREERTVQVTADRMGMRYRPTWPLAIIVVALIAVVTWLQFEGGRSRTSSSGRRASSSTTRRRSTSSSGSRVGTSGSAGRRRPGLVVLDRPRRWRTSRRLTTKWPPNSPLSAFFAPYIPIIGLWRPYTVIRDVLTLLTDRRVWPQVVALAWWIWLRRLVLRAGSSCRCRGAVAYRTDFGDVVTTGWVRCALLVMSAVLAIGVVLIIERWQWTCARRRETAVVAAEASRADLIAAGQ